MSGKGYITVYYCHYIPEYFTKTSLWVALQEHGRLDFTSGSDWLYCLPQLWFHLLQKALKPHIGARGLSGAPTVQLMSCPAIVLSLNCNGASEFQANSRQELGFRTLSVPHTVSTTRVLRRMIEWVKGRVWKEYRNKTKSFPSSPRLCLESGPNLWFHTE